MTVSTVSCYKRLNRMNCVTLENPNLARLEVLLLQAVAVIYTMRKTMASGEYDPLACTIVVLLFQAAMVESSR